MKNMKSQITLLAAASAILLVASTQATVLTLDMTQSGVGPELDGVSPSFTTNGVTFSGSFSADYSAGANPGANPEGFDGSAYYGVHGPGNASAGTPPQTAAYIEKDWAEQAAFDVSFSGYNVMFTSVKFNALGADETVELTIGGTLHSIASADLVAAVWTPSGGISLSSGDDLVFAAGGVSATADYGIVEMTFDVTGSGGGGATTNLLQQWTFNQPNGTQLTALTNTVSGGGNWNVDKAHMTTSNHVLHVTDATAFANVQAPLGGATNGLYELSWTFTDIDLTSPDAGGDLYKFTLDETPSQNELLDITLNYAAANGKLLLKAEDNGTLSTIVDFGTLRLLTNVDVRVVFDLDADTYDVYVNNNGTGEALVANDFAMIDGEMDLIRMKGAMNNIGATGFIDIDNLTLVEIIGGETVPSGDTSVLNLKNQPGDTAGEELEDPVFAGQGFTIFSNVTLTAVGSSVTTGGVFSAYGAMGVYAADDQSKTNEYPGASTTGWEEVEQALSESITFTPTFNANLVTSLVLKQVVFQDVGTTGDRVIVAINGVTNYVETNVWDADVSLNSGDTIEFSAEGAFGMLGMTFETVAGEPLTNIQKYEAWVAGYDLGTSTNLQDDADGDLLDNLTEYAWGGEPDNGADQGNTPVNSQVVDGSTNYLQYVYCERDDAMDLGLSSSLDVGTDLVFTNWGVNTPEFIGRGASSISGYNAVTNRIPTDSDAKQFIRLQVQLTE